MFILKLWFIIILVIAVLYFINKDSKLKDIIKTGFKNTPPEIKPGETYKECEYCGEKNERTLDFCIKCGRQL